MQCICWLLSGVEGGSTGHQIVSSIYRVDILKPCFGFLELLHPSSPTFE